MAEFFRLFINALAVLAIPLVVLLFLGWGLLRKVKVYEVFVEGAKEGFTTAVRIIPYLVAMLVAIGIFRASGALEVRHRRLLIALPPQELPDQRGHRRLRPGQRP